MEETTLALDPFAVGLAGLVPYGYGNGNGGSSMGQKSRRARTAPVFNPPHKAR